MIINLKNRAISYTLEELVEIADDLESIVAVAKREGSPDCALFAANVLKLLNVERRLKS